MSQIAVVEAVPGNVVVENPPAFARLPLLVEREAIWKRLFFLCLAVAIAAGFGFVLLTYWAPAPSRPGIDENAYLVGGKEIAQHATIGFKPTDDYQYVGAMWLRTAKGWYYPKYPFGTSFLDAITIWIGGSHHREWTFLVSPVCMSLAILGMFFLARAITGSFLGLMGMIVLASCPTTLQLANWPGSHSPALCMVIWGMFFLLRWWQSEKWAYGIAGGLLLGYAVTCRYTEALLLFPLYPLDQVLSDTGLKDAHPHTWWLLIKLVRLLPVGVIGLVALCTVSWKWPRTYLRAALPIIAWGVPVFILVTYNWFAMAHVTGYDATNESTGFSTHDFLTKWDTTVYQLYLFGLFLILPLGVAGMVMLYGHSWRAGLLLTLWFVPGGLLYTSYYFGDGVPPGVTYLRFFLTLLPPVIIGAMWLLGSAGGRGRSITRPIAVGVLTAATASLGIWASIPDMERQHRGNLNLHYSAEQILAHVNPRSTLHHPVAAKSLPPVAIADEGMFPQLLMYMQFMGDCDWYATDVFDQRAGGGFGILGVLQAGGAGVPAVLQKERIDYIESVRKGKTDADYIADEHRVMEDAFKQGRKVYLILTPAQTTYFRQRFIDGHYKMKKLDNWIEPCKIEFPGPTERQGSLVAPAWSGEPFIVWHREALAMYEVTPLPTTRPVALDTVGLPANSVR
jgi:Dolichyl-phosphate-mannose-protein mannosyltransferase